MIEFLNCRDLGTVGIYLRSDYSINCTSASYQYYKIISIFGIILFPIGIPLLFFLLIRYRYHPLLSDCAKILYGNFDKNWKYYEVYDLIRKLLLTSILLFISTPDSPSRCLYLLIIDLISLNIISYCQPYYYFYDNFLATIFIILEILSFLIGLIITSKIYQTEDYNYSAMFTTLIMMIIISILFITPMTFILKLNIIKKEYLNYLLPQNSTDTSSSTTGTTSRDERENTTPTTTSTSTPGNAHHSIKFKSITLFNENNHPQNNNNNDPEKEEDPGPPFSNTQNAHDSSPTTSTPTAYDTSTDADSGQNNSENDLDSTSMNPSNHTFPNEGNSRNSLSFRSSWMWLPQRPNQSRNPSLSPSPDTSTNIELSNTIPTRNSECFSFPESRE